MSETTTETVQDTAQEVAPESQNQSTETPDVGSLIAESKKYRNRAQEAEAKAQEAESKLAEYETLKQKQEEELLAKQNKWEELATKKQSKLDKVMPDYERLIAAENAYKQELLDKFPEEERDAMSSLSVEQLRIIYDKINLQDAEVPSTSSTPARSSNPSNKNWVDMTAEERRSNWGSILQSYVKR